MSVYEMMKSYVGAYGDTDVRSLLAADHRELEALVGQMVDGESTRERVAAFEMLKPVLTAHARSEEASVYARMVDLKGSPDSRGLGNEGFVEHSLVDVLMERLGKTEFAKGEAWKAHAKVLKELLTHHIKEEEGEMFKEMGEHFSDEQREAMGADFTARKQAMFDAMERQQAKPRLASAG